MDEPIAILWLLGFGGVVALGIFILCAWYRAWLELQQSRQYLIDAKRETEEIVQLPLNTPYPLVQITSNGQVVFANPAALKLFPDIREHGLRHPVLVNLDQLFVQFEKGVGRHEVRDIKHQRMIYRQTIAPAYVAGQKVVMVYFYDVTPLIEAQEQLEKSRRTADEANQAKSSFLANMSHELRTPMNGIIGLSDILQESVIDGEHKNLAAAVHQSAQNLLVLLNDILDFSKIEAGEVRLEHIAFDIRSVIGQIMTLQSPVAAQKSLTMAAKIDPQVPSMLTGDPTRIQQILMNLINNALKFTHQGGITVQVSGTTHGAQCQIKLAVQDTGIGIPKDKQADVFAKFAQADVSTTRKYGGTGLGLSITRDLIHLMRGHIELESAENIGSTFTIHLPLDIAASNTQDIAQPKIHHEHTAHSMIRSGARVLVVDDHPVNLLFMRTALQKLGVAHFDESSSGEEAVAACQNHTYDLIFMDCQMPGMDGLEATRRIRHLPHLAEKAPVIIALTADAMKGVAEKCAAAGMNDYLSKPVDRARLTNILYQYLGVSNDVARPVTPVAPQPKSTTVIFDPARLDDFAAGDTAFQQQLINVFIASAKQDLNQMAAYDRADNHDGWVSRAHKIYGASINIGAMALALICDTAQVLPPTEAHDRAALQQQMIDEYKRVRSYLTTRQAA